MRHRAAVGTVVLTALSSWAPAQVRVGPEFQVNVYTPWRQQRPVVGTDASGGFVVAWEDYNGRDGDGEGVFGRRFDGSATPQSDDFQVNTATTSYQGSPSIAVGPTGAFVVVWDSFQDGPYGIFGQRYDATGAPLGGEFQINAVVTGVHHFEPSVAFGPGGNFVVAWTRRAADANFDVVGRLFDASAAPLGPEFVVNTDTTGSQIMPAVTTDAAGRFVVAWTGVDGSNQGVFARRFAAGGAPSGDEFLVNMTTSGAQQNVALAGAPDGSFVVAWDSDGQDGSGLGIFARRYDATGTPAGGEFQVNGYTTGRQSGPALARGADGGFLVGWAATGQDGDGYAVLGRRYDASGSPFGLEFRISTYTVHHQARPAIALQPGGFVVVWHSEGGQDGHLSGVFGQRIADVPDLIFADGFESGTLVAWSAAAEDGGDLSVSGDAALNGTTAGLQAVVDDEAGLYVEDATPAGEDRYRARFYLDPNGFDPGEVLRHFRTRIFVAFQEAPSRRLAAIVLRRKGMAYGVMGRARLDDDSHVDTGFFPIADEPHFVELDWWRASGANANDGFLRLWIDGTLVSTLANLDNSASGVDFVRLGALSVKTGASGTMYWDEFESRRESYIGP